MGTKLYVGNLSYSVDSTKLAELFTQVGPVDSANVIMDRDSGRSKGFGFVEMSVDSDAQAAISKLNGTEVDGRALNVSQARPQTDRPNRGGGGGGRFGGSRRNY